MVVTSSGRPIALLSSINENNLEQVLTFRRARAADALAAIQYESIQQGTDAISMDEINAEIKAARSKRKK
ncbi:MAG: type II toxin-antitoxin system Phd/YefM family antitoxin [Desulfobacterales bacterium]